MTLEDHAKDEIQSCCQTLCESNVVVRYIKQLESEITLLKQQLKEITGDEQ